MDPFIGSGTTAEAALSLGRRVLGFEVRESYCKLSAERINAYLVDQRAEESQGQLFPKI